MPPYTTDTSPEAHEVQLECIRRMPAVRRVELMRQLSDRNRELAFAAIRRLHPDYDEDQVRLRLIEVIYGESLASEVRAALESRNRG